MALDLLVDEGEEDHSVDVSQCVSKLREQRVNMVQSQVSQVSFVIDYERRCLLLFGLKS